MRTIPPRDDHSDTITVEYERSVERRSTQPQAGLGPLKVSDDLLYSYYSCGWGAVPLICAVRGSEKPLDPPPPKRQSVHGFGATGTGSRCDSVCVRHVQAKASHAARLQLRRDWLHCSITVQKIVHHEPGHHPERCKHPGGQRFARTTGENRIDLTLTLRCVVSPTIWCVRKRPATNRKL